MKTSIKMSNIKALSTTRKEKEFYNGVEDLLTLLEDYNKEYFYSLIDLNLQFSIEYSQQTFGFEITLNNYKDIDLDYITTYLNNEKKSNNKTMKTRT